MAEWGYRGENMKTIKDFTDIELKSFAYDALATIEKLQNDLKAINQELAERANAPKETPKANKK